MSKSRSGQGWGSGRFGVGRPRDLVLKSHGIADLQSSGLNGWRSSRNEGEETAAPGYGLGLQSDKASLSSSGWMKPRRKLYSIYIRFLSQPAYMYSMLLAGPCCVNP